MKGLQTAVRRAGLVILALLMLLSMLPPVGVSAATTIEIKNIYTSPNTPTDSNNQSVTRVSTPQINIEVGTNGISGNQLENIQIEVLNVATGFSPDINMRPVVSDNGFDVTFYNVDLTEGLNRIVVKMAGVNGIQSVPGWVYYVPSVRIDQLVITDTDENVYNFNEDTIYPVNTLRSDDRRLEISGRVYNADRLTVKALDDPEPTPLNTYSNEFGFLVGPVGTNSDIFLQGGDNILTFAAENNTYHTTVEKNIIYDDGQPFVYDVRIKSDGRKLLKNPQINTASRVTIVGKMKLNNVRDGTGLVIPEYLPGDVQVEVAGVENTASIVSFDRNLDERLDEYDIYDFELEVDVNLPDRYMVRFIFERDDANRTIVTQSNLSFTYSDPNRGYIDHVAIKTGRDDQTGTRISEFVTNEVTEQPMVFFVYTDTNTTDLDVTLEQSDGDVLSPTRISAGSGSPLRKFEVEFDAVTSGPATLEITPQDNNGPHTFGKKRYSLHVSSTPYIISNKLHNGLVIESMEDISCGTGYCFTGRFVNVPNDASKSDISVYLNNALIPNGATTFEIDRSTMSFTLRVTEGNAVNSLVEGLNNLEFVINLHQTGSPATVIKYSIYKFTKQAPQIIDIQIDNDPELFTEGSVVNTFFTNEDYVRFVGSLASIDEVQLTVRRTDEDGEREVLYDHWERDGNDFEQADPDYHNLFDDVWEESRGGQMFETRNIGLSPIGDTTFEFVATNSDTNLTVFRTITITREPVPYKILYPQTFNNANNLPQANINSNFVEVFVQAEYADEVIYDKQSARKVNPRDYNFLDNDAKDVFAFEVNNLRGGRAQTINFTVVRGQEELRGSLAIFNSDQPEVGASFKSDLKNRLRVFNDLVDLQFERNTSFKRYGNDIENPFLSTQRQIVFGIANRENGKVNMDGSRGSISESSAAREINRRSDKFIPAAPLIWIDAGEIRSSTSLEEAYTGSGKMPYEYPFNSRRYENIVVPNKRATLTLKYDDSIVNEGWRYLTVFQYGFYENRNGDIQFGWQNIGGVVDTRKKTITVSVDQFGYFQVMYMKQSFEDVVAHDWAKNDIETLFSKGYMQSRPNAALFSPYEPISRGEFITMLVKIFDIPLNYEGTKTFRDTENLRSDGLWEEKYIETAARAGISRGVGQLGYFSPNNPLTREQAAVMIARAASMKLVTEDRALQNLQKSFTDAGAINTYARPEIEAVTKQGLMAGKQHSVVGDEKPTYYFDPAATLRRDEAAAIAIRVLQNQKKIPK